MHSATRRRVLAGSCCSSQIRNQVTPSLIIGRTVASLLRVGADLTPDGDSHTHTVTNKVVIYRIESTVGDLS